MTDDVPPAPVPPALASGRPPASAAAPAATFAPLPAPPGAVAVAWDAFWKRGRPAGPATLGAVGATGILGGLAIVDNAPGLGLALTGLAVIGIAVPPVVRGRRWADLVLLALAAGLVAGVAVRDAEWLVALSILAAALLTAVAVSGATATWPVLLAPVTAGLGALRSAPWLTRGLGSMAGAHRARWGAVARSLLATAVLLVVFTAIFAGADAVFAAYLPRLTLDALPARVIVGVVIAWAAATCVHLALAPPGWSAARPAPRPAAGTLEWAVPVFALGGLQAAFVLLQLTTLIRGHDYVLRTAGVGYAEYAREGFGQLLLATVLTLMVLGVAARRAPRATPAGRLVTRAALGLLALALLGVVGAALRRMDLYVDAFGLTRLRIVATTAEIVLGVVVLLVLVAGLRWRGGWLPRAVVTVTAVALLALVAVNPDALVLRHNAAADRELDLVYLRSLSADAAPAAAALPAGERACLLPWLVPAEDDALAGWNLARARAAGLGTEDRGCGRLKP